MRASPGFSCRDWIRKNKRLFLFVAVISVVVYIIYYLNLKDRIDENLLSPHPIKEQDNPDVKYSQAGQDEMVYNILPKENGFYIEMGAFDGKHLSNTLWLERQHHWLGLLIEANPDLCRQIDSHMRHAWRLCGCISNNQKNVDFVKDDVFGALKDLEKHENLLSNPEVIKVQCYRLRAVLDKIGIHHIDYFSLDVEGAELLVLESIKDDLISGKVRVDVWTIEYLIKSRNYVDSIKTAEKLKHLKQFFEDVGGFFLHSTIKHPVAGEMDAVFVNIKTWCKLYSKLPNGQSCKRNQ
ncbi:uncharacterized protein LOC134238098 [Saccostrea cucullata]|uniref:uncharacterized protein LOC134238098 n=1 Tax=Saccostrea cuccullata TaxID=36930 RepID=UPI002ED11808